MIYVDVIVPDLDKKYEFCCDETMKIALLTEQMIICVEKAEAVSGHVLIPEPWLFCKDRKIALDPERTLSESGVSNVMTLFLL